MRGPKFGLVSPHAPRQLLAAELSGALRPTPPAQPGGAGNDSHSNNKNKTGDLGPGRGTSQGKIQRYETPVKPPRGSSQRWLHELWLTEQRGSPYLRAVPPTGAPTTVRSSSPSSLLRGCRCSGGGAENRRAPSRRRQRLRLCVCVSVCVRGGGADAGQQPRSGAIYPPSGGGAEAERGFAGSARLR